MNKIAQDESKKEEYELAKKINMRATRKIMELKNKGLSDEAIDGALSSIDSDREKETAKAVFEKYMRGKTADKPTLQKAYRHLLSKGFDYEVIKSIISFEED